MRGTRVFQSLPGGRATGAGFTRGDLDLSAGEFIVLRGPPGSGKSTLLNILGGLGTPDSVHDADHDLNLDDDASMTQYRRAHIVFLFQFYNLIQSLTAHENVALVTEILQNPMIPEEARALTGLIQRIDPVAAQMSCGEQQRVAISCAVDKLAQVLLCEELTGALDTHTGVMLLDVNAQVNRELGTTTVVIHHNTLSAVMADRVVNFDDGLGARVERNDHKKNASGLRW